MKKIKKSIILRGVFISLSILLFVIGMGFKSIQLQTIAVMLLLINNIQYTFKSFTKDVLFFSFNITFFIFLIGRIFVSAVFHYKENLRGIYGLDFYEYSYINITLICLFISLISLFTGYIISKKVNLTSKLYEKKEKNDLFIHYLRKFSILFFYICIIFRLLLVNEMKNASVNEGYFETFTTFQSSLPSIVQVFANMYDVALFAFLSTKPSKKNSIVPILLYLLEGLIAAIGGRRSNLMLNILIIFIYYLTRNEVAKDYKEKWFKKLEIFMCITILPVLVSVMTIIGNIRADYSKNSTSNGIINNIMEFFYSQGVSANLIGYTEVYRNLLPKGKVYTLGPLMEFINNSIMRRLNGLSELTGQSVERATSGFLYSQALPYLIMPIAYLNGHGYGSSFVAENFVDLSYSGVLIGSLLYGMLLGILTKLLKSDRFIVLTFTLIMARAILFSPRAAYLSFIVSAFTPSKIVGIIIIYIGAKLFQSFDNRKYKIRINKYR